MLSNSDFSNDSRTQPRRHAPAALALGAEVEMHFTSTAVRSLFPSVADGGYADAAHTNTVADFIREAKVAGVRLLACSMALHEH
jgi:predicted peroxiredoxin